MKISGHARGDRRDHRPQMLCVGPGRHHPFLGFTKLGGRDHFHGFGDFLSAFDAGDAPPYFA
jgi:hypothetical protein